MSKSNKKKLILHNKPSGPVVENFKKAYPVEKEVRTERLEEIFPSEASEKVLKDTILLARSRGQVFRPCPGTSRDYLCCNYWVLNQSVNCPFNCSYCILQYYLNNPYLTVFTDLENMKEQIRNRMAEEPSRFFRIGTGELADSLALNEEGHFARPLIEFAAKTPNMILELKTKSALIDSLISLPHKGKTILAWSINTPALIRNEEHGAASLDERLQAIDRARQAKYKLAFHFDPVIYYPGWEKDYEETVRSLFSVADPALTAWISIGSLRFPPDMKDKIVSRFPSTQLTTGEMVRGRDGKMRYFKPLRIRMYRHLLNVLRKYGGTSLFIYFCMEDRETWLASMGTVPESNEELDYLFARHLYHHFPGLMSSPPQREHYLSFKTPRHRDQF